MSAAARSSTSHLRAELVRSLRGPGVVVLLLVLAEVFRRGAQALGASTWAPALGWGSAVTLLLLLALARRRARFNGRWVASLVAAWVAAFALTWLWHHF
jgi:hypothetical protein